MRSRSRSWERLSPFVPALMALGLMLLAAALRLPGLRTNPGWYTDEGSFLNVAVNLANGRWEYFALKDSLLLLGRPPLFVYLLAALVSLVGPDMLAVRALAAACSIANVGAVFLAARSMFGDRLGLLAGSFLAILPGAVSYGRMGFTYNLLAPLAIATIYSLWKFTQSRRPAWLMLGSFLAGLGLATDYQGLLLVAMALVTAWRHRPAYVAGALAVGLVPLSVCLAPLAARSAFTWSDLAYTFTRGSAPLPVQFAWVFLRLGSLVQRDGWFALGLVGVFLLPPGRPRNYIVAFVLLTIVGLFRAINPVEQGYYHLIPLLPFISVGLGCLLARGVPEVLTWMKRDVLGSPPTGGSRPRRWRVGASVLATAAIVVGPIVWMAGIDWVGLRTEAVTFVRFGKSSPSEVEVLAREMGTLLEPDDVVLASPQIAWLLSSNVIEMQQAVACAGDMAHALPALETARFLFPCELETLDYAILDDLYRDWAADVMAGAKRIVLEAARWPLVLRVGEFSVYRNPASKDELSRE